MLTRLTHSAIAFAVTAAVYQAYVLIAAPLIEPPQVGHSSGYSSSETPAPTHKYRTLLAAYFPPGHWTLTKPPITAENGLAMIVLDEFKPSDDGQVRVNKCAILFFPRGRVRGEPPPSDAVVLEAPHGALLQMDKSFKRGMGSFGQLQSGKLTGEITVRSNMREPGTQDDLLLTTRDVEIREDLIYTMQRVAMQLGPHRGSGRHLEIRLVDRERGRSTSSSLGLGSIDSLEVFREVEAQLSPGQVRMGFDSQPKALTENAPPVRITSQGKFRFDFPNQVASFVEQVELQQVHPQGLVDQLRCEQLSIYFTDTSDEARGASPANEFSAGMSAGMIEAEGNRSSPVLLSAPSQEATARCERMRIELGPQRITLDRGPEVVLSYQGSEIHAKQVQYQAPPKGSRQRLGKLLAAGSGWLRARTSEKPGAEPFEVRWTENLRLRRVNGEPVLTLNGRPRLDMVGMGRLWADHFDLYLRESAPDGSEAELLPSDIVPRRLVAGGNIDIESPQLRGAVKQLEVQFDYTPSDLLLNSPAVGDSGSAKSFAGPRRGANRRKYDIAGNVLNMLVTVHDRQPEVTSIDVEGQVAFRESSSATNSKQPLQVESDRLRVENADSPTAKISLQGKPAKISADGMTFRAEQLQVNRGTSRAWVDAPGEIETVVDRDLSGKRLATPQPMTIRWQRRMELWQDHITFDGNVQVQTVDGTLDTQQMVVGLTAPVQFDGASGPRRIEIAQLECHRGVNALFSQRDALGLASVQTIKLEESFVANLQNGKLQGTGPGWIESVHLSSGSNPLQNMARDNGQARLAATRPAAQPAQRLRFLGVRFNRGIQGNLQSKQVQVYGDVDAVYGPVDAWEQKIPLTKRGMPGPETIWIRCNQLGVAESPLTRLDRSEKSSLGPLELIAEGSVIIEGPAGERGNFTTQSRLAKYDQLKKTFILEGTNQLPATITVQEYRGGPRSPTSARKFTYHQETGIGNIEGLMNGNLRQTAPVRNTPLAR